uniref:VP8 n=1 Tax=Callinectes sapidus reovirus 2 TaxID=2789658 RepID=A0A8K1M700_9REOV|nr:VP8 [Callinectes sapidus reovirus 2]
MALAKDNVDYIKGGTGTVRCIAGVQILRFRYSDSDPVIDLPLPGSNRVDAIAVLVNSMRLSLIDYDGKYRSEILTMMKRIGTSSTFKVGRRYQPLYMKKLRFDEDHPYVHSHHAAVVKCRGLLRFDGLDDSMLIMERCKPLRPEDVTMHAILSFISRLKMMHANGVVHEDVRPDNLMLSNDDEIVLVDPEIVVGAKVQNRSVHYLNIVGDNARLKTLKERMALDVQLALQSFLQIRYKENFSDFMYYNGELLDNRPEVVHEDEFFCTDWQMFTEFQSCDEFLTSLFAHSTRKMLLKSAFNDDEDTDSSEYDDEEDVSFDVSNRSFLVDES